jgi:aromatic-L-amino-acid decarboxylase
MAEYFKNVEQYPVKSQVKPGDILRQLPDSPPEKGEPFQQIMDDFERIIIPGITHWQHPRFFAYFNANNSFPSVLAEMLTATLGAQCMIWQTSPAATELEEQVMRWLAGMIGLPPEFDGVIQDTASTATLCSLLTAREKYTDYAINHSGFYGKPRFTIYCSTEAHSSIEKDVKIAGFGRENLRKIPVDDSFAMIPEELEKQIQKDMRDGYTPLAVIVAIGTTGSTAIDPLRAIGEISKKYNLWVHVDAAYAGTALVLPELRWMIDGIEYVDTFVFNPHKWMFTNFDCSAYFVRDKEALIQTFEIMPEYLKTPEDQRVNNYRDWGIQLGRRFRALKLWFVIRSFGVRGIQQKVRQHIQWAQELAEEIDRHPEFERLAPVPLATVCFRFKPAGIEDEETLTQYNSELLNRLNNSGKVFLTHTKLNGRYTIRFVVGQTQVEKRHVQEGWQLILETAEAIKKERM